MFTVERQDNSLRYEECRTSATARSVCLFFSLLSVVSLVDVAFSELGTPLVRGIERELAGPLYQVRIEVTDKAPLDLGAFDDREEAERFCEQLCEAVARKD